MARRDARPDPKEAALAGARCLNPHPEQVTDPEFLATTSSTPGTRCRSSTRWCARSRPAASRSPRPPRRSGIPPAYYAAAAALESSGLDGLVPARPGPRGASKLTEEILAWAEEQLAADPALRPAQLPDRIEDAFGVRVHPRSVERALARRRERHSKSR